MIVVKLLGGIGNQMFEYAFGRYLALKNKTELKLDLNSLGKSDGGTIRQFELSVFNIHAASMLPERFRLMVNLII